VNYKAELNSDLRKVCHHIRDAEVGDVSYYRYFTGNGVEYHLVCSECSENEEDLCNNLREITTEDFKEYDKCLFTCVGFKGYPQIKSRKTDLKFEHINLKLKRELGERVLDFQPLDSSLNCVIIALTESFRLLKIDLDFNDYIELCRVNEITQVDPKKVVSIKLSKHGNFCAIVNIRGQYGAIIDILSGKVLMQLDRGNYHNEASDFPIEFIKRKEKDLIIHSTAWNRLDISDPLTGETITKRELLGNPKVVDGKFVTPDHYLDYFHASLKVSDNYEWIVDNGWFWHPVGIVVKWSVEKWLEENVWESEDGFTRKELLYRIYYWDGAVCWIDDKRVAIFGFGDDDDWILPAVTVFDVMTGEELYWFAGPDNWLVFDKYLFSASPRCGTKVWDIDSGELLHADESFCPQIYHKGTRTFVSKISDNEYKLSKLI